MNQSSGFRSALRVAGVCAAYFGFAATSTASADVIEHVSVGVGYTAHDLFGIDSSAPEQGSRATADVLFKSPGALKFLGRPRPFLGAALSLDGYTNFLSTGLAWRASTQRLYLDLGFGGAVHDGETSLPRPQDGLSLEENRRRAAVRTERTEFGYRTLYHARFATGVRINERWAVELAGQHWSNGHLDSSTNDGADLVEVRVAWRPGR